MSVNIKGMNKTKNLFLALVIALGVLFAGCCASIITVVVNNFDTEATNIMALVSLMLHLLILAVAFYLAFKAFYTGKSSLIGIVTIDEHGFLIKKSRIVAIVVSALFMLMGIYGTLLVCGLDIWLSFFATALKHTLMNVGYSIGIIALFFILYPLVKQGE